ncbi:MAG: translocation/assembly module TamB domain-containing protein [Burkholderiales bacterium]|nr:translocation/assembly module TamB domain-containing protein [Burkholderiales bacterium]MDE2431510.1 translocation/assembly module TamB domain-containing protein [Burkholderiales bacterium]
MTEAAPPSRWRQMAHLVARSLIWLMAALVLGIPLLVWSLLHSEGVTRAVLLHVPGVRVWDSQGALLGDFRARRVEIDLPRGSLLTLDDAAWRALSIHPDPAAAWWFGLHAKELRARLVQLKWVPNPHPGPSTDPYDLRLPLSVTVDRVLADRGDSALWGDVPLKGLDGRLEMEQAHHLARIQHVEWGGWSFQGEGWVKTLGRLQAQLNLTAAGQYQQQGGSSPIQAQIHADGPLTALAVRTQATVGSSSSQQRLDADVTLKLWAPWMLPALHVKARDFDLAALSDALPRTSLSGTAYWDTQGPDMRVKLGLKNALAGNWQDHLVPVRDLVGTARLPAALHADSLATLVHAGEMQVTAQVPAQGQDGVIALSGTWNTRADSTASASATRIQMSLNRVSLQDLDARAPALVLSGDTWMEPDRPLRQASDLEQAGWRVGSRLTGRYRGGDQTNTMQSVQATLNGLWRTGEVAVSELVLQSEGARASVKGKASYSRDAAQAWQWRTQATLDVDGFDPRVWLPWPHSLNGANRLKGSLDWDVASDWRGQARLRLDPSVVAGTPVQGSASWNAGPQQGGGAQALIEADLIAAGNRMQGKGQLPWRLGADGWPRVKGDQHWDLDVNAPALNALQTLASVAGVHALSGQVSAQARFSGQWPSFDTEGHLNAQKLAWQWDGVAASELAQASASWAMQTMRWDAPLQWQASLRGLKLPHLELTQADWTVAGTGREHRSTLNLQGKPVSASSPSTSRPIEPMQVTLNLQGGLQGQGADLTGWRGRVQALDWVSSQDPSKVWLQARPFDLSWRHRPDMDQLTVSPTGFTVMGAEVSLKELEWQVLGTGGWGQIKTWLQLEPLNLAKVLKQWQPQAGWGGDMTVAGQVYLVHSPAQPWSVQAKVSKVSGDLTLSEPSIEGNSQQSLGIDVAAVELTAQDGNWVLSEQFDGRVLGRLSGRQTVRVSNPQNLPSAHDILSGQLDLNIDSLRPWAAWIPAGWRLSGQLVGRADLGGTLGAPEYRGALQGKQLRLANGLLGVNLTDGRLALDLQGDRAHLTELSARAAQGGAIRVTGQANLGAAPQATLDVQAERFAVFQRIDRRLLVTGQARAVLGEEDVSLTGKVRVDEGLFDFSRSDAPTIGDDVNVLNGPGQTQDDSAAGSSSAAGKRKLMADVDIDLGDKLHLRGRGLDTDLTGNVKFTTPNNRPSLQGTVKTVKGTYVAYGQKLDIEHGFIVFSGPIENPRLDILAMRRQSPMAASNDVKVGVKIAGTAQDPRVSLYSDPAMSETDKLSWLILGRGSSGLGGADIGLLQSAAVALLSGEGPSTADNIMSTLGIDELSLKQSDGTVRETVVNVGKQLSKYWYLGYERNLNATSGNWQLIYRLAQRFTVRAQTGVDNAIDFIWSWRWD